MPAILGPFLRPYGQEATLDFALFDRGEVDFDGGLIAEAGDSKIIADEQTAVSTFNNFVQNDGGYALVLTPTEMQCARAAVYVKDQSNPKQWIDTLLVIETYGNPSSQHPDIGKPPTLP